MLLWHGSKAVNFDLTLTYSLTHLPLLLSIPLTLTSLRPLMLSTQPLINGEAVDVDRRIGAW